MTYKKNHHPMIWMIPFLLFIILLQFSPLQTEANTDNLEYSLEFPKKSFEEDETIDMKLRIYNPSNETFVVTFPYCKLGYIINKGSSEIFDSREKNSCGNGNVNITIKAMTQFSTKLSHNLSQYPLLPGNYSIIGILTDSSGNKVSTDAVDISITSKNTTPGSVNDNTQSGNSTTSSSQSNNHNSSNAEDKKQASTLSNKNYTEKEILLDQLFKEGQIVYESGRNIKILLDHIHTIRNLSKEREINEKYVKALPIKILNLDKQKLSPYSIINFITYGTISTKGMGEGERAGVVNSFLSASGRLPLTLTDWQDVIKISNGRWPSQRNIGAENRAKEQFRKIYLREPDISFQNDNAAMTIITYGLRPAHRNLASEIKAIYFFESIFGFSPNSATDWDSVRAISYSGAKR